MRDMSVKKEEQLVVLLKKSHVAGELHETIEEHGIEIQMHRIICS